MIWGFIAGFIAGAVGVIRLGKYYAEKKAKENNNEI